MHTHRGSGFYVNLLYIFQVALTTLGPWSSYFEGVRNIALIAVHRDYSGFPVLVACSSAVALTEFLTCNLFFVITLQS